MKSCSFLGARFGQQSNTRRGSGNGVKVRTWTFTWRRQCHDEEAIWCRADHPEAQVAEVEIAQGATVAAAARKNGVTEQTYYRWKKEYGGLKMDQAKRLKDLEKENTRLKRLLADAELDKAILREAASGNF